MDEWLDIDPAGLTDVAFERLRARLDGAELATAAAWDARGVWASDGALSGAAWLRARTGMAGSTAREKLRLARQLQSMPLTARLSRPGRSPTARFGSCGQG